MIDGEVLAREGTVWFPGVALYDAERWSQRCTMDTRWTEEKQRIGTRHAGWCWFHLIKFWRKKGFDIISNKYSQHANSIVYNWTSTKPVSRMNILKKFRNFRIF